MNLLFSTIGKRGYIADYFRQNLTADDRIIGTGNDPWTPGFHHCDDVQLMPDINSADYLPAVLDACDKHRIDAVLSFSDPDVFQLAEVRDELINRRVVPLFPDAQAARICFDKWETASFLDRIGVAHPRTARTPAEADGFGYPLFVKARTGSGSASTFRVDNTEQLRQITDDRDDLLIQEFVDGDEINVEVLGDLSGEVIGMCSWRKHLSTAGETLRSVTVREPDVIAVALQAARELRVVGPMDIDLMRTDQGVVVIEFNPRFGGGYPTSQLAGADFPTKLVDIVLGKPVEPNFDYRLDVAMMKDLQIIGGPVDEFLGYGDAGQVGGGR